MKKTQRALKRFSTAGSKQSSKTKSTEFRIISKEIMARRQSSANVV